MRFQKFAALTLILIGSVAFTACGDDDDDTTSTTTDNGDDNSGNGDGTSGTPTSAFDDFNSNSVTVTFNGEEITIESTGLPSHTSPYWETSNSLYIDPIVAEASEMSPGFIMEMSYSVTVPASPEIASSTTETGLGAIGIAVSGVPIYNDQEGQNTTVTAGVASGFDYNGGHVGPTGYHYHIEASDVTENTMLSSNDHELVGIMSDGFLLYGRKCNSTGDYPTDLDESGGHTSNTQHSDGEAFYHYHVINEIFLSNYYVLFGVPLQGTPSMIM